MAVVAAKTWCAHAAISRVTRCRCVKSCALSNRTKEYYKDRKLLEGSLEDMDSVEDLLPLTGAMRKSYSYDGTESSENNPGLMYVTLRLHLR